MPVFFHFRPTFFDDFENIKNLQNSDSVQNKQSDEPDFLVALGGKPKGVTLTAEQATALQKVKDALHL